MPMSISSETTDLCPKRFGLNYDPPSIVLEYLQVSTGKLFHRRIGLRRLRPGTDPARVAEKLRQKNPALLDDDKVSFDQIISLVTKLQSGLAKRGDDPRKQVDYHKVDLNKLSTEELNSHKAQMDIQFFQNQKKPGDNDFVYDVQVDFGTDENAQPSGWDSDEDLDTSGAAD